MQTINHVRSRIVAGVRALHNDESGQLAVENIAIIGLSAIIMLFGFKGMFGQDSNGAQLASGNGQGLMGGMLSKVVGGVGKSLMGFVGL